MLGGAAGQQGPRYGNLPIWENVIKSLNNYINQMFRILKMRADGCIGTILAIFFGSGACWGVQRGRKGPDMGIFNLGKCHKIIEYDGK